MKQKVHYSTSNLNGKKNGASTIPEEFSLDHKRRNRKKWKRYDSSDSDSVELKTPLTTLIFDFH